MIWKIAWKNIIHKPLSSILCASLVLFGVGIISFILIIQQQFEDKFKRDLKEIDIVVGAKGSPLQLVLSSVYHIDAPTGNIELDEAKQIMDGPMIKEAIPLAYGDSYQGFRILGTTLAYIQKYNAPIKNGRLFKHPMEVTLGASIAEKTGLQIGDTFVGTHGEVQGGDVHDEHPYTVVGILDESKSVVDNLIFTKVESVWQVHSSHEGHDESEEDDHAHEPHEHMGHAHEDHEHDKDEHHDAHTESEEREITAILIQCKSKMELMRLPRFINQRTNMQAVLPGLEINRLFYMLGIGVSSLNVIGAGIMIMAGFSVFLVLLGRLRERRHELALMRSVGFSPFKLFSLLLIEGILLSSIGYILGILASRLGLYMINHQAASDFNLHFRSGYIRAEFTLLLLTIALGSMAALLPAYKAMRIDVSSILSKN